MSSGGRVMVGFIKDEVYYIKLFCQLLLNLFFRVDRVSKIILFFSSMFSSQHHDVIK